MPMVETFRGLKAGSTKPLFARNLDSAGKVEVSLAMSWRFLAVTESPSRGKIEILEDEDLKSSTDHRNGSEMGRSFLIGLISLLGGDGDVGGDEASLIPGLCRPSMSWMTARLSGDRRRRSSSSPDSPSVAVSEAITFLVAHKSASVSARSLALVRLAARFWVLMDAAVSVAEGSTLSSRSAPSNSSRHLTPLLAFPASSSGSGPLCAISFTFPLNRLQRLLKSPRCEEVLLRMTVWSRSRPGCGRLEGASMAPLLESDNDLSRSIAELKSQSGPSVCGCMNVCQEAMQRSVNGRGYWRLRSGGKDGVLQLNDCMAEVGTCHIGRSRWEHLANL